MYTTFPQDRELADRSYTIGELAEHFDITLRSIRFYEHKGLIRPLRSNGAVRVFTGAEGARLGFIVACRRLGLSVSAIAALLAAGKRDDEEGRRLALAAALRAHRDDLEALHAETAAQLDGVARWLDALEGAPPSGRIDGSAVKAAGDPAETRRFASSEAVGGL